MSDVPLRVFVNESPLNLPVGSTVAAALQTFDPALASRVEAGTAAVTDGRGLPLMLDAPLSGGAILRVVGYRSADRAGPDALP